MKVLVIGGGGREHAIIWKLAQGSARPVLYCAPGNGGISQIARPVDIQPHEVARLLSFAQKEGIDLTVVGPEIPLSLGLVDLFKSGGLKVFGPRQAAARVETSKVFSKELLLKYGIPTARALVADGAESARRAIETHALPLVIKAEGLAAGKGVVVARERADALRGLEEIAGLGEAAQRILIEDFLEGEEMSYLILTDGERALPLGTARDHKRIFDGDLGPNTGGMGAISPSPQFSAELDARILETVIYPTLKALSCEGSPYQGVLYAGLMLTREGPKVLEFNARFGDPETQAILPRLESDLVELMDEVASGSLPSQLKWRPSSWAACVVAAARGYPGRYAKGDEIHGLDAAGGDEDLVVFHAGTVRKNGRFFTSGGRVLGVTGMGRTLQAAQKKAYGAIGKIHFEGMHYRKDIGIVPLGPGVER